MPRKSKVQNNEDKLNEKSSKNLFDTIIKDVTVIDNEDIILQLPITEKQLKNINKKSNVLPEAYDPNCCYINNELQYDIEDNNIENENYFDSKRIDNQCFNITKTTNNCYWCCHPIEDRPFGMPYKYICTSDTYILYGSFCSLHCANAYNFSVHCGSDKVWEINSFIQMLSKNYGYTQPIRPAPSRFLLKIFNGPLTIEEFRNAHITCDKTHLLNIPPMISTTYNYEVVNTSYLKNITDNMNTITKNTTTDNIVNIKSKNTIDSKLNLIFTS